MEGAFDIRDIKALIALDRHASIHALRAKYQYVKSKAGSLEVSCIRADRLLSKRRSDDMTLEEIIAGLLMPLAMVESGGDPNAYNSAENAAGILQIRPIYVEDVNRILGKDVYTLEDRYSVEKSCEMAVIYLKYYGRLYARKVKRQPTYEVLARIHNGGPDGWAKPSTNPYWEKVKQAIEMEKRRKKEKS